jgi:ferrochelatase
MSEYRGEPEFEHGEIPATGVLLTNLGTPDAPTTEALRRYLREFLSDPRVIELPRWKWSIILNLFVLPTRPRRSAEAYRRIWTDEGSPILLTSRAQAAGIAERLQARFESPIHVALGMRYGQPSIPSALDELRSKGCRRVLLLPLYPQYAGATTASTFDAVTDALQELRWIPELRTIHHYHDDAAYIEALAASVREVWDKEGPAKRLLMSFHGIPKRYFLAGDPYYCHCQKTARLLAEALDLEPDQWLVSFQSRFGREEWIQPYTDETLENWGKEGLESVDVICPGFSADCLETIDEIDLENREEFEHAGGGRFRYLPALNDRADHLDALAVLIARNLGGWAGHWDADAARANSDASRRRADERKRSF